MCIVCVRVSVCVCVRESKRALTSHYTAFQVKPAKPTPSWEAVCRSCSRFLLSASPIVSQQHCTLQSSSKCHLSRLWWLKATSYGMLSQMLMAPGFDSKSAYFFFHAYAMRPKVALVSFSAKASVTLRKNQKSWVCCCIHECPIDFYDFQEQIQSSHNGRHVCMHMTLAYDNVLSNQVR